MSEAEISDLQECPHRKHRGYALAVTYLQTVDEYIVFTRRILRSGRGSHLFCGTWKPAQEGSLPQRQFQTTMLIVGSASSRRRAEFLTHKIM